MSISQPVQITVPFATGGLKNTIPAAANPVDGHAGYDVGFPAINMTPKVAGGIPPFGQDFNGILFAVTEALRFIEAGGSFPYSSAFSTAVGGYPLGALVSRTDGSGLWRTTTANNTTDPETGGAGWAPDDAGNTALSMTNANVTLTSLQAARSTIVITGILTTNLQLIFPTYAKEWLIVNNCTGAFTVTAKTSAGSGVAISTGSTQVVYGDGTNISPYTGNASQPFNVATATSSAHATSLAEFAAVLATTGSVKIPVIVSGVKRTIIIQWITAPSVGTGGVVVNWNIAFPNALLISWSSVSIVAGPLTQFSAPLAGGLTSIQVVINTGTAACGVFGIGW